MFPTTTTTTTTNNNIKTSGREYNAERSAPFSFFPGAPKLFAESPQFQMNIINRNLIKKSHLAKAIRYFFVEFTFDYVADLATFLSLSNEIGHFFLGDKKQLFSRENEKRESRKFHRERNLNFE
jgi:hypothetical protein